MSSLQLKSTKLYSVYQVAEPKASAGQAKADETKVEKSKSLLTSFLASRASAQVSTGWQRETGIVPIAAYSEGKYTLQFRNGKEISVLESAEEIGMKVWDCAALMSRWFEKGDFVRGRTVLELGAGTGLLGYACAVLGAKHVVITDIQSILATMEKNVEYTGLGDVVIPRALNWNDMDAVRALKDEFGHFDMIVASDVLVFAGDARMDGEGGLIGALCHLADVDTEILMGCNKNRHGFLVGFYENPPHHLFKISVVGEEEVDPEYYTDRVMLYRMFLL